MASTAQTAPASRPEIGRSIEAGGILTNYHDVGEGAPVLLIHGSGPGVTAWANWRINLPVLGERFRVIAPDMVGFGYSGSVGAIRDKSVWTDHLASLLDALEIDRVSLVGNSFGGAIALAFMIAHPDRVDRAVLMGAVGLEFPITEALDFVWGYQPSLENMRRTLGYLSSRPETLSEDLIRSRFEASIAAGAFEPYTATFGEAPRQRHITMLASDEASIAAIEQEVLILHGAIDQVIPAEVSLRLGGLIPRSDVHLFGGCGHWVQIERARSFNRIVGDFLADGLQ